jgi:thiol:disulfide interchange protein DsbD
MNKKNNYRSLVFFFVLLSVIFSNFSSYNNIVTWDIIADRDEYRKLENVTLEYKFSIKNNWHIYSVNPEKSPQFGETAFEYLDSVLIKEIIDIKEPEPITKFDKNFQKNTSFHEGEFSIFHTFKLNDLIYPEKYKVKGILYAIACDPSQCVPIEENFEFELNIKDGIARDEYSNMKINSNLKKETDKGFIPFILFSLGMGFLALLTPCVFPMIPITISFFTKLGEQAESEKKSTDKKTRLTPLSAASIYATGIIIIFTLLGLILALTLGASGASMIAQSPWINLLIGLLFIFFAFSLFGYYELQAPQFLTQYSMKQESQSGYTGILFMSLTFTLASFTCTAALVGTLLVAASQGEYFWPIVGMLSFSTAFASPFFLLALFPQYLAKLPKSGGWLNSVKVIMGFLELAAAFKFISNSDLVWNWNIFDREMVLFIWVIIIFLISLYSLGLILFPHDTKPNKISFRRKTLFAFTFIFSIYLSTGLFTNKVFAGKSSILKVTSGLVESYLPPPKASSMWIEDLDLAYIKAKEFNKPIFLDFTGYTCTNCRWMEINIFEDKEVVELFDKFILVKLYTDGREEKHKRYRELEINRFKTSALPYYVVLNQNDEQISTFPGYNTDVELFKNFLKESINKFKK